MSALPPTDTEVDMGGNSGSRCKAPRIESCPVCGHADGREVLRAPDRLHGRNEQYTLARCEVCSLVWLKEPPKPEEMHKHYTAAYNEFIAAGGEKARDRWNVRKETLARHKQAGVLLDLGCSSGSFLTSMRGRSWNLYGIEMSPESANVAAINSGGEIFVGTILNAPFGQEMFDVVTCFDVLEHLQEPVKVMKKVAGWLKPNGIFFVQVPNIDSAEARIFGRYWQGLELPRHLFHYSPDSLRRVAEIAGLDELSIETGRNQTVETSLRYLIDDAFRSIGITRTPLVCSKGPLLPWRVARKLWRMTVLKLFMVLAPAIGGGEAIIAIFQKPA